MGFFKKLIKVLMSGKYSKNTKAEELTTEQYTSLNIGAINAEQTMSFYNSLATGVDKSETTQNLANYYEIDDRETALETLQWFLDSGHRVFYEAIKGAVSEQSTNLNGELLDNEQKESAQEYMQNLNETIEDLEGNGFIQNRADITKLSILAWDMGRLVLVARCCYDLGYITEDEAWDILKKAKDESCKVYKDWSEFGAGYIIGRCMWSGPSMMISGLIDITKGLIEDEDSPWKQYLLKNI